ncbi:hypothetical protein [Arthrobacter sp. AQ5-05]|uniref:hypothetical protein n=1 Tax=Arthrobacter sp. AQ5-05 TaxID=2184581 RepID=UPI00336A2127
MNCATGTRTPGHRQPRFRADPLFTKQLFDRLALWACPILLGSGKKLFANGVVPANLKFIEPVVASPKGAVMHHYLLANGTPGVGEMPSGGQEGWNIIAEEQTMVGMKDPV